MDGTTTTRSIHEMPLPLAIKLAKLVATTKAWLTMPVTPENEKLLENELRRWLADPHIHDWTRFMIEVADKRGEL
jgi:hypothetical protein